jgi:uncharacterized protein (DUF488 family)
MNSPLACPIGHTNRTIEEFISLLCVNGIQQLLDVRTLPRSRHNSQFNCDVLPVLLAGMQISYSHMPGLGGLRHPRPDSSNSGWHNASFRGYADYMQSAEFADNVDSVAQLARTLRCVLMCAEAVPWRCHRSLIADALIVRGVDVEDIISTKERKPHLLTSFARVRGSQITYPAQAHPLLLSPPPAVE